MTNNSYDDERTMFPWLVDPRLLLSLQYSTSRFECSSECSIQNRTDAPVTCLLSKTKPTERRMRHTRVAGEKNVDRITRRKPTAGAEEGQRTERGESERVSEELERRKNEGKKRRGKRKVGEETQWGDRTG